jgi:hypothetical protein
MTPTAAELNHRRLESQVAETLAQTFGLLKPLEPTDRYAGHNRYWLFLCSGCDKQTTRSLSDVKRSFRRFQAVNTCPPSCLSCMAKAKVIERRKANAKKRRQEPEQMGRFCNWCGGMPHRRPKKAPCRGCGQSHQVVVVDRAEARGLGGQPWV